ncbi:MAG: protein kinase [Deltaproteobacteria bacterium]|nr:protein kinase [Deltaproteobacteria bacterium]
MDSPSLPEKMGRYRILRELGRGGMGVVYLAHDPFIDRNVAIKATTASLAGTQGLKEFQDLFFNEARTAGRLDHPHIVSVYDAAVEAEGCYLVMEYVDGATLKEHLRSKGPLPLGHAVKVLFQCAKALDYAHENGVVHRDIKPSNILLSNRGDAMISDFGIAAMEGEPGIRAVEGVTGSVFYTAPELIRNEPLSPQADLFSLGVVMYETLTGARPFEAETDMATIFKITSEEPLPLRRHREDVPEALEEIVLRALEKDRTNRYRRGMDIASDLRAAFDGLRIQEEEIRSEERLNALRRIPFFRDFKPSELTEVMTDTQWLEYNASSVIITEGEIEDCFYIIVAGEVEVRRHGKPLAVLKPGDCFGEMAHLGKTRRTATIEALVDTVLMKVNASVIEKTSTATQLRFYKVFSNTLIRRLNQTSKRVTRFPL